MTAAHIRQRHRALVVALTVATLIVTVACSTAGVPPTDPRLQPPLVGMGLTLTDFLRWIGLFGEFAVPPPWIVSPATISYSESKVVQVQGWSVSGLDRVALSGTPKAVLRLYQVSDVTHPAQVAELAQVDIGPDRQWRTASLALKDRRTYLAAKTAVGYAVSGFSNVIVVFAGDKEIPPVIETPKVAGEFPAGNVTVGGRAEPDWWLALLDNDQVVRRAIQVGPDGSWSAASVNLTVGEHRLRVRQSMLPASDLSGASTPSPGTLSSEVKIKVSASLTLVWPFGSGEGESYRPDTSIGQITSWFGPDDFHYATGYGDHTGIDIRVLEDTAVHAVADGEVIYAGWRNDCVGNVAVISHGGWESWYLHLLKFDPSFEEKAGKDSKDKRVKMGDLVGGSGGVPVNGLPRCSTGGHLHLEVRKGGVPFNINPPKSSTSHFQDSNTPLHKWYGDDGIWQTDWLTIGTSPAQLAADYYDPCAKKPLPLWGLGFRTKLWELEPALGRCDR